MPLERPAVPLLVGLFFAALIQETPRFEAGVFGRALHVSAGGHQEEGKTEYRALPLTVTLADNLPPGADLSAVTVVQPPKPSEDKYPWFTDYVRSYLIARYGAEIDHEKAGYPITAFVSIELERQEADSLELFERRVMDFEEVVQGFLMTGSQDFLLRVVVEDLHAFERFLQHRLTRIPGIRSVRSRFALRQFIGRNRLPSRD